jgi:transposase
MILIKRSKDIMIKLDSNNHSVFLLYYHLVLVTKYRRKVREIIIAPQNYASSQICSECGYKNIEVKELNVREWMCPNCNTLHDRDINASKNLVKLAM